jgi:hypothetical protein
MDLPRRTWNENITEAFMVIFFIAVLVVIMLALLGPSIGNVLNYFAGIR